MVVLALLLALVAGGRAHAATPGAPSFVVIQTDDQTLDGLYATARAYPGAPETRAMPATLDLIAKKGITFNRYYVSYPLCCPSRVSLLTGRYAHNHKVKGNIQPNGGYIGFSFRGAMTHNLATWLQADGYKTVHIGKFLNGYGEEPLDAGTTVPPGWSTWYTILNVDSTHLAYGYKMDVNGQVVGPFGDPGDWETREYGVRDDIGCPFAPTNGLPCYHVTDALTNIATSEIAATPGDQPLYLQLDYTAPHGDFRRPAGPEPTPRHYDWFRGATLPHDTEEGLDEGDVSDKPRFIREASHLSPSERHTYLVYWQKQLEALRDVDDGVRQVVNTLGAAGRLNNTYIIFTSDNGFFFGEHRLLGGKFLAYEPATHLPLLIRGPGIKPGTSTGELAANIDIAPTVLELSGANGRQEHRRAFARPVHARLQPPDPAADPVRVVRRNQRRRGPGGADDRHRPDQREVRARTPCPTSKATKRTPRCWRRRRTTPGSGSAPTSTSPGRPERRSSTTSIGTPTSSTHFRTSPTSSRSGTSSTAKCCG